MYCRNCGTAVSDQAVICVSCGVPPMSGSKYCPSCAARTDPNAIVCVGCGISLAQPAPGQYYQQPVQYPQAPAQYYPQAPGQYQVPGQYVQYPAVPAPGLKSKLAGGLLGIFLGAFGVHNFYLGYTGKAVAQLLLSVFGLFLSFLIVPIFMFLAAYIWGLVEGIMILSGSINTDAKGYPLGE